jgi:hypothetical protein
MTRRAGVSRYNPLVTYLRAQPPSDLTLTLSQVETIVGGAVPHSGYVDGSWWHLQTNPAVRAWEALGWRAYLNPQAHAVTFLRTDAGMQGR